MQIKGREIKAVVFDLDGTLADSIADISDAMNRVLESKGLPVHSYREYKYFVGKGLKNLVLASLPEDNRPDELIDECHDLMMQDYGQNYLVKTSLYDGIEELINTMYDQGIRMAVLSNKAEATTKKVVSELLGNEKIELVLGMKPSLPRKPDPAGAVFISEKFGIPHEQFAYIGDTNTDMQTALNAGMLPVGVLWGFRSQQELIESGAQVLLKHPMELIPKR
ncbi:MAG: HAD family hydrolase [Bacteroidales bacterium]|nr:HAD family hydrolase [Bacteroidales bacterium]MCF8351983.1 HAD family hydrolase [Bacteroidales bacterium]MCF8377465.1 HAD family hydrolase [Bacteroidales bacterium]MCF8401588.1 HAD family hydrolase [Bacteroidales bacterium]